VISGLRLGTQVGIEVRTLLNDNVVYQDSVGVDNPWCLAMGSFRVKVPDLHVLVARGTSVHGDAVVLGGTVMGVIPRITPVVIPTPQTRPVAPSNFRTSAINSTTVRFDWTDNSDNERGFRITSRGGEWTAAPNAGTLNVGGQQHDSHGSITCYTLSAFNDAGPTFGGVDCLMIPIDRPSTAGR
jgi:hypothetical protein